MCRDYACVWYRDFPIYCVQDKEEDSPSCIAAMSRNGSHADMYIP